MLYRYNHAKVDFQKINTSTLLGILTALLLFITIAYQLGFKRGITDGFENLSIEAKYQLISSIEDDSFSEEKLIKMLQQLNVRFPHIVMAQAIIESGHFQSNIFRSNRNLFGMKQARSRCTTAKGTELNHAYYDNWRESVYDYAFFQSRYLNDLKTEEQYLEYLDRNYAEAPDYDKMILKMVAEKNLRKKFQK
jgi:hypothetical protein